MLGKLVLKVLSKSLIGSPGFEKLETNANNEVKESRKEIGYGSDVYLTIDVGLQNYTYDLLKDKEVYNRYESHNGDILSFVSHPGYDINLFARGISPKDYKKLLQDKANPLFNRALIGQYPGSTIKLFLELLLLKMG